MPFCSGVYGRDELLPQPIVATGRPEAPFWYGEQDKELQKNPLIRGGFLSREQLASAASFDGVALRPD
jgi:hypothetical protein